MKKLLFLLIVFTSLYSQTTLAQKQIVIEHVDFSEVNQTEIPGAVVLSGNVSVLHDGIRMTCHKAYHFTKENYIKLFGDVKNESGDTLFMDSRYAEYNGNKKFAYATGNVLMRSPDMRLTTDTINFDRTIQQAYYNSYGTIVNGENTLKSKSGRYIAGQKKYEFRTAVTLTNPKHVLKSNHLDYYTNSGHSYVFGPSTITSKDDYIYTEKGFYDTKKNQAELLTKSYIKHGTQVIRGDKLYYDKQRNYSSGTNNVRVKDTVNKYILEGHYAEIYRKPVGDSLIMTKHAVAKTLVEKDTLYTHAKFMVVTGKPGERVVRGYNNARFYKVDMSGKCDSIHSDEKKGLTQMIKNPVVWNGDSQLTGDKIHLISNSKTEQLDSLKVLGNAFVIQKDTIGTGFNQVKGKNLYGKFRDNKLYEVDLIGNAEKIVYMYDKTELFGIDKGKGSSIHLDIVDNKITTFILYKNTESEVYPDSEFPESVRKFRGFVWRGDEMILTKDDIFPQEEKELHDKIVNKSETDKKVEDTPMEPLKQTLEYDKKNPQPKPKPEVTTEQKTIIPEITPKGKNLNMEYTQCLMTFLKYQAQTSPYPLGMEVSHAKGSYIYDTNNKAYLDFVAGVSATTLGHQSPRVNQAIIDQLNKYSHVMVYGEYAQHPAVELCRLLAEHMPPRLNKTYLVNSGTEATEGALKLARRVTGRSQLISCFNAYHGNTMGSMSVMGFEERKQIFRPLIPDVDFITFNNEEDLQKITTKTAGIILETIQGGAGFIRPHNDFLKKVRQRCDEVGAIMILDEIQPGFGRTGKLFGFQNYDIVPDVVVMGKGMGGGMPVGAFTANEKMMDLLSHDPKLGHITTFGGHPVIAAACLATLQELTETDIMAQTLEKEKLFRKLLVHPLIKEIRGEGLMLAPMTESADITNKVILRCQEKGLILFWLLFEGCAIRITPPLTITEEEITEGCGIIIEVMNEILAEQNNN